MSLFITRDYGTPKILLHTASIARKNLTKQVFGTTIVDGVEVLNKRVHFYSNNKDANPDFYPPISDTYAFRSDKLIKRWYKTMGISLKDMRAKSYSKVNDMYHIFNPNKVIEEVDLENIDDTIVPTFNSYVSNSMLALNTSTGTTYYYANEQSPNSIIATLPFNSITDNYIVFNNSGIESNLSSDGYFSITKNGIISVTLLGVQNGVVDYVYGDNSVNTRTYSVKKVTKAPVTTSFTDIHLAVRREYVDIRIIIGGEYTLKAGEALENWIIEDAKDLNTLTPYTALSEVREIVESDPLLHIGNIYPDLVCEDESGVCINDIRAGLSRMDAVITKTADIYKPVAGAGYNEDEGYKLDVLALLDDGTVFELVTPVFNETMNIVETAVNSSRYNLEYSYTKRYKVKSTITKSSAICTKAIYALGRMHIKDDLMEDPLAIADELYQAYNTAATDSTLKEAIYMLAGKVNDDVTDVYFYKGHLRLNVFNEMSAFEFDKFLQRYFDTQVETQKTKWYNKVLGIVIAVVGVVLVVVGLFTHQYWLVAIGLTLLTVGGTWYANHIAWGPGVKLIGLATVAAIVAIAVYTGYTNYTDIVSIGEALSVVEGLSAAGAISSAISTAAMASLYVDLAIAVVGLASAAISVLTTVGVIDSDSGLAEISALVSAATAFGTGMQTAEWSSGLTDIGMSDISGGIKLLSNGMRTYTAYNDVMQGSNNTKAVKDTNPIESDNVDAIYVMRERVYEADALENIEIYKNNSYGVNSTIVLINGQML